MTRNIDHDGPFHDVLMAADAVIATGAMIFQKFTCGGCGARQTMPDPNAFYTHGECEKCGHVTELTTCGYMAVFGGSEMQQIVLDAMRDAPDSH